MAVNSARTVSLCRSQTCGISVQRTLGLTRILHKESMDIIRIYKASQGEMSQLLCKTSVDIVPDPNISGLEPSERLVSIDTHLQAFFPHIKRVFDQQADLQLPSSRLLAELAVLRKRSRDLAARTNCLYQNLFPNLAALEPAGGPTSLPPPQNVFQQKVYGCVVLKTYKEFLSNVSRELRTLKSRVCKQRTPSVNLL